MTIGQFCVVLDFISKITLVCNLLHLHLWHLLSEMCAEHLNCC
jgi:hypothetical protein